MIPRIRFILTHCSRCGAEYRVRLERIGGEPREYLSCGDPLDTRAYVEVLQAINRYREAIPDLEAAGKIDGETLNPKVGFLPGPFC